MVIDRRDNQKALARYVMHIPIPNTHKHQHKAIRKRQSCCHKVWHHVCVTVLCIRIGFFGSLNLSIDIEQIGLPRSFVSGQKVFKPKIYSVFGCAMIICREHVRLMCWFIGVTTNVISGKCSPTGTEREKKVRLLGFEAYLVTRCGPAV